MRFAASQPVINAMAIVSGYNPGDISSMAQKGRSKVKQTGFQADSLLQSTENEIEGYLTSLENQAAAQAAVDSANSQISFANDMAGIAGGVAGSIAKKPGFAEFNMTNPVKDMSPVDQLRAGQTFGSNMGNYFAGLV